MSKAIQLTEISDESKLERLETLEDSISMGLRSFYEVGSALTEIRDAKLYRLSHSTFEGYCKDRWEMSKKQAYRLIDAADVMSNLLRDCPTSDQLDTLPMNEAHTRELSSLVPEMQQEVWRKVVETAPGGRITAKLIRRLVLEATGRSLCVVPNCQKEVIGGGDPTSSNLCEKHRADKIRRDELLAEEKRIDATPLDSNSMTFWSEKVRQLETMFTSETDYPSGRVHHRLLGRLEAVRGRLNLLIDDVRGASELTEEIPEDCWTVTENETDVGSDITVTRPRLSGVIYEPSGKAREYSPLACNTYRGCSHGCRYCYAPGALRQEKSEFHSVVVPKTDVLKRIRLEAGKLRGDDREICLSFIGDPYDPVDIESQITRSTIEILMENGLRFTVLTKGGSRAERDFDLLRGYDRARFGTSLVFTDQSDADCWEPHAASIEDRIATIRNAHARGIPTWVSLEPVIDPKQALELIEQLHPVVGSWKVGKLNYRKSVEENVDWLQFRRNATELLESVGASYYLKDSLTLL